MDGRAVPAPASAPSASSSTPTPSTTVASGSTTSRRRRARRPPRHLSPAALATVPDTDEADARGPVARMEEGGALIKKEEIKLEPETQAQPPQHPWPGKRPPIIARLLRATARELPALVAQVKRKLERPLPSSMAEEERGPFLLRLLDPECVHPAQLYVGMERLLSSPPVAPVASQQGPPGRGKRQAEPPEQLVRSAVLSLLCKVHRCTGLRGPLLQEYAAWIFAVLQGPPPNDHLLPVLAHLMLLNRNCSIQLEPETMEHALDALVQRLDDVEVDALPSALDALQNIAWTISPRAFQARFDEVVETLLGWLVLPDLPPGTMQRISNFSLDVRRYFDTHMDKWIQLLWQMLEDLRASHHYHYAAMVLCLSLHQPLNSTLTPRPTPTSALEEGAMELLIQQRALLGWGASQSPPPPLSKEVSEFVDQFHLGLLQCYPKHLGIAEHILHLVPISRLGLVLPDLPLLFLPWGRLLLPTSTWIRSLCAQSLAAVASKKPEPLPWLQELEEPLKKLHKENWTALLSAWASYLVKALGLQGKVDPSTVAGMRAGPTPPQSLSPLPAAMAGHPARKTGHRGRALSTPELRFHVDFLLRLADLAPSCWPSPLPFLLRAIGHVLDEGPGLDLLRQLHQFLAALPRKGGRIRTSMREGQLIHEHLDALTQVAAHFGTAPLRVAFLCTLLELVADCNWYVRHPIKPGLGLRAHFCHVLEAVIDGDGAEEVVTCPSMMELVQAYYARFPDPRSAKSLGRWCLRRHGGGDGSRLPTWPAALPLLATLHPLHMLELAFPSPTSALEQDEEGKEVAYFHLRHPAFGAHHVRPLLRLLGEDAASGASVDGRWLDALDVGTQYRALAGPVLVCAEGGGAIRPSLALCLRWYLSQVTHYLICQALVTEFGNADAFFVALERSLLQIMERVRAGSGHVSLLGLLVDLWDVLEWALLHALQRSAPADDGGGAGACAGVTVETDAPPDYGTLRRLHERLHSMAGHIIHAALLCGRPALVLVHGVPLLQSMPPLTESLSPESKRLVLDVAWAAFALDRPAMLRGLRAHLQEGKASLPSLAPWLEELLLLCEGQEDEAYAQCLARLRAMGPEDLADAEDDAAECALVLGKVAHLAAHRSPRLSLQEVQVGLQQLLHDLGLDARALQSTFYFGLLDTLPWMRWEASTPGLQDMLTAASLANPAVLWRAHLTRGLVDESCAAMVARDGWEGVDLTLLPRSLWGPVLKAVRDLPAPQVRPLAQLAIQAQHLSMCEALVGKLTDFEALMRSTLEASDVRMSVVALLRAHLTHAQAGSHPACISHLLKALASLFDPAHTEFPAMAILLCHWTLAQGWDPGDLSEEALRDIASLKLPSSPAPMFGTPCLELVLQVLERVPSTTPELLVAQAQLFLHHARACSVSASSPPSSVIAGTLSSAAATRQALGCLQRALGSMTFGDRRAGPVMVRVLSLLPGCVEKSEGEGIDAPMALEHHPCWLAMLPSLMARLAHPNVRVREMVEGLLSRLCCSYPHQLRLPVLLGERLLARRQAEEPGMTAAYRRLRDSMDGEQSSALVASAVDRFVCELRRISSLWNEQWFFYLGGCLTRRKQGPPAPAEFEERLAATVLRAPETPHEERFGAQHASQLHFLRAELGRMHANAHEPSSNEIPGAPAYDKHAPLWKAMSALFFAIKAGLETSHRMEDISPYLANFGAGSSPASSIPLPGRLDPRAEGAVGIAGFAPEVQAFPTKTRPKRITIRGTDGCAYRFLCKGYEDLRLDEKVQHVLGLCNDVLGLARLGSVVGSARGDNAGDSDADPIPTFGVIPLAPDLGLIQWVERSTSLFTLYSRWRAAVEGPQRGEGLGAADEVHGGQQSMAAQFLENAGTRAPGPEPPAKASAMARYLELEARVPASLVRWHLRAGARSPRQCLERLERVTLSLAHTSLLGFLLGIGDRHLDNMLFTEDGRVLHIDFNVCFEKGLQLRVPETVPFRLTRNLRDPLLFEGGAFVEQLAQGWEVLQHEAGLVEGVLEALLLDPLEEWLRPSPQPAGGLGATSTEPPGPANQKQVGVSGFHERLARPIPGWLEELARVEAELRPLLQVMVKRRYRDDCALYQGLIDRLAQGLFPYLQGQLLPSLRDREVRHRAQGWVGALQREPIAMVPAPPFGAYTSPTDFLAASAERKGALVAWIQAARALLRLVVLSQGGGDPEEGRIELYPPAALAAMHRVHVKLRAITAEADVRVDRPATPSLLDLSRRLVRQATNPHALCRMYEGWMAWV